MFPLIKPNGVLHAESSYKFTLLIPLVSSLVEALATVAISNFGFALCFIGLGLPCDILE